MSTAQLTTDTSKLELPTTQKSWSVQGKGEPAKVLELADTAHRALDVAVPREHEDRRIRALTCVVGRRVRDIRVVIRVWDGGWRGVGGPGEAAGELGDGSRAAVRFVGEAENRVDADLRARQRVAGRVMDVIQTRIKKTRRA